MLPLTVEAIVGYARANDIQMERMSLAICAVGVIAHYYKKDAYGFLCHNGHENIYGENTTKILHAIEAGFEGFFDNNEYIPEYYELGAAIYRESR